MNDTDTRIEKLYRTLIIKKSGEERLKMGFSMFEFAVSLILNSLLNKNVPTNNLNKEIFIRVYGNDFDKKDLKKILSRICR